MKKLLILITALFPSMVFSHTGHLANDAIHGLLHVEHVIVIAAISLVACTILILRGK